MGNILRALCVLPSILGERTGRLSEWYRRSWVLGRTELAGSGSRQIGRRFWDDVLLLGSFEESQLHVPSDRASWAFLQFVRGLLDFLLGLQKRECFC